MKRANRFQSRTPRTYWLVLLIAGVLFLPGAADTPLAQEGANTSTKYGSGLLFRLPKDGSWVRFEEEVAGSTDDGMQITGKGTLGISSVGQINENGENCRWIEVKRETTWDPYGESTEVFKFLIPEKHLARSEVPLDHVVRGWRKRQGREPEKLRLPLHGQIDAAFYAFLPGPLKDVKDLNNKDIEVARLGKLKCTGVSGTLKGLPLSDGGQGSVEYKTWLHEKGPFGVIMCRMDAVLKGDNQRGTLTDTLKLVDFGTDAVSELPDNR